MSSTPMWIGDSRRPALGWLDAPAQGLAHSIGVVICPPVGYEYWSSHHTLRALAGRLAAFGYSVLRLDYTGTGDSAGHPGEPGQWGAWQDDIVAGAERLRSLGCSEVSLVGLRVGALLALLCGHRVEARSVVAWAAVRSGRRYGRELRLLGLPVPEDRATQSGGIGGLSVGGALLSAETLDAIGASGADAISRRPAPYALLIENAPVIPDHLRRVLEGLGTNVSTIVVPDGSEVLDQPAEYAPVSHAAIDRVAHWMGGLDLRTSPTAQLGADPEPLDVATSAVFEWEGHEVREDVVVVGPDHLAAVRTRPGRTAAERGPTVVWLNSGSEHHVGPGRAWVEFARSLAVAGWASLRVDFSGWGESPDRGSGPGRPYDPSTIEQTRRLVDSLQGGGQSEPAPVVAVGICAGAWVALAAAIEAERPPLGIVALNPQLYWRPGDPVEANIETETHVRRAAEIARWRRLNGTGLWSLLDRLHIRHPAAQELRSLRRVDSSILWLFANGDDGLEFLHDRVGRAWRELQRAPGTTTEVLPHLDHSLRRNWDRHELLEVLTAWLKTFDPSPELPTVRGVTIDLRRAPPDPEILRSAASEDPAGPRPLL